MPNIAPRGAGVFPWIGQAPNLPLRAPANEILRASARKSFPITELRGAVQLSARLAPDVPLHRFGGS